VNGGGGMNVVLSAAQAGIFLRNSKKQICQQILTGFPANPFFSL